MKRLAMAVIVVAMGASCAAGPSAEPTDDINEAAGVDDPTEGGDTNCNDPLLLDLGTGVAMSDVAHGAVFDLDGDGTAHRVAWPTNGGWLALDINHDGKITSGAELFGSASKTPGGLESLAAFDDNADGIIDANDAVFVNLRAWEDKNRDGVSQPNELSSMADRGIAFLGLAFIDEHAAYTDTYGNRFQGAALVGTSQKPLALWGVVPSKKSSTGTTSAEPTCKPPQITCIATCYGTVTSAGFAIIDGDCMAPGTVCGTYVSPYMSIVYDDGERKTTSSATSSSQATANHNALVACDSRRNNGGIGISKTTSDPSQWSPTRPGCTPISFVNGYTHNPPYCVPSNTAPTVSCQ